MMKIGVEFKRGILPAPFKRNQHQLSHHAMGGTENMLIRIGRRMENDNSFRSQILKGAAKSTVRHWSKYMKYLICRSSGADYCIYVRDGPPRGSMW
jgi:hypothetical protein